MNHTNYPQKAKIKASPQHHSQWYLLLLAHMEHHQDSQDNDSLYSWSSGYSSSLGSNNESDCTTEDSPLTKLGM